MEGKMVPERYMDIISCEFAYDPVRLPLDQDPTQSLYNRKTLETIWETKRHAQNPFTKQWSNAKSAIPQIKLRQEMEDYIKLQKSSECKSSEMDVIDEYTKTLEEGDMKQYLDILGDCLSENVTTKMQCCAMWKKINLLRMYCQFDSKNTETSRSLHGLRYLNELILKVRILLVSNSIERDVKEIVWDVCKEIGRAIRVIGLKPRDLYDVDRTRTVLLIGAYIKMIEFAYLYPQNYIKIESLMLRIFCKVFDEMITTSSLEIPVHSKILVEAIIICIAREIDTSEEMTGHCEEQHLEVGAEGQHNSKALEMGLSEEQLVEVKAEGQHNSKALELGLSLVKDIVMTGGPLADNIHCRGLDIVDGIIRILKHFSRQGENQDAPTVCVIRGCNKFDCVHFRIAQLGWDISTAIWRMGEHSVNN